MNYKEYTIEVTLRNATKFIDIKILNEKIEAKKVPRFCFFTTTLGNFEGKNITNILNADDNLVYYHIGNDFYNKK